MTPPLKLRPIAKTEIREAHQWYEEQRPGLGQEFLDAVADALGKVEDAPKRYPVVRGDVRRALTDRFPYSILYIAEAHSTVVVGCFHAKRDPGQWHGRR